MRNENSVEKKKKRNLKTLSSETFFSIISHTFRNKVSKMARTHFLWTAVLLAVVLVMISYLPTGAEAAKQPTAFKDIKVKNENTTVKAKTKAKTAVKLMLEKELGYLEARRKDPNVKKLPSGMHFKIIKKGEGLRSPNAEDPCEIRYAGYLADGTKFDSHEQPSQLASPIKHNVKGWSEALQMMREGDHWEIYLPHHLAFGVEGVPGIVPEYAAIKYDIELLKVIGPGKDAEDNEAVFLRHFGKEYADM